MKQRISRAFEKVPRENFLRPEDRSSAFIDAPIGIGYGQTNSQPTTVRMMLEWLDPKSGERILDVGSGSGWTSALLANLVGDDGYVYAVEKVPGLVEFGRSNAATLKLKNLAFYEAGPEFGWAKEAPYDRILVSAAAEDLPLELLAQLKTGGRLVIPVKNDILVINKQADGTLKIETHPGFMFVPLV